MARTTYQAPGVYVEEVPSAQQPIAGVGTNTVGFIGVVDDFIYCPEPLPEYDPVAARAFWVLSQMRDKLDSEGVGRALRTADESISKATAALKKAEEDVAKKTAAATAADDKARAATTAAATAADDKAKAATAAAATAADDKAKAAAAAATANDKAKAAAAAATANDKAKAETDLQTSQVLFDKAKEELADLQRRREALTQPGAGAAAGAPPAATPEGDLEKVSVLRPYTLKRVKVEADPLDTRLCTNFSEYTSKFGSFSADDPNIPRKALSPGHRALTHAVYGFFKNGGTRCFVARIKPEKGSDKPNSDDVDKALLAMESIDAIAIIAAPGLEGTDTWDRLVAHCEKCEDRFAILDSSAAVTKLDPSGQPVEDGDLDINQLNYGTQPNLLPHANKNAAFYFPHIEVIDPAKQMQDEDLVRNVPLKYRGRVYVPPSGHIAGIYARTDEQRGVHKAPANTPVLGAVDLKYYIGKPKQELLNPQGVNCIRNMNGNINVWGARTIGGDQNGEWKYVSVRRFFLFLRESIDEGTQWVVFEPNDYALWGKIRRNVTAFLTNVWRSGALFGATPEEAFYVKCDAETNPAEVRDVGMVVTEIGVAIVRPAEFVIFRVTQSTGGRTT